jgi:CDP-diacylglycerol--glycerol-3-phosphate 3-phosphatidyltransferase
VTFTGAIGRACYFPLRLIIAACVRLRIHPNLLTFIGVLINVAAGWELAFGHFVSAGVIMIVANIFDFIDGKVATETGLTSAFGGFWDSVIDRFSDLALSLGLICLYSSLGRTDYVLITSVQMVFATMTSYTRARAESLIAKCKVGFMERPERIVLFMIGAFTNRMAAVMWVIGVLAVVTVINRIIYTYRELSGYPSPSRSGVTGPVRARLLLDGRPRHGRVRHLGDRDPGVRLAHAARLARRPDGRRRTGTASISV